MNITLINLIRFINLPKYKVYRASIREVVELDKELDPIFKESMNNIYNINFNEKRATALKEHSYTVTTKVSDDNLFIEAGEEPFFVAMDTSTGVFYSYVPLFEGCKYIDQRSIEPFFSEEERNERIGIKGITRILRNR